MPVSSRTAALALALLGACSTRLEVPAGAVITCSSTADCPAGRVCGGRGRCIDGDDIDPPGLVGNAAAVSPARGRAGTAFTIRLEATEPLEAPPRAILGLAPLVELACAREGAGDVYTCPYQATGEEHGGLGGRVPLDVRLADLAGNERILPSVGALDLDFTAPALAARSVEPSEPAAARLGGLLQVFFTTAEELGAAPVLVASRALDPGAGPATRFTPVQQPGTRNWTFTHAVGVLDASGPVDFTVELTDLAGNAAAGVPVGRAVVDAEPPGLSALSSTPARIRATGTVTVGFEATEPAAEDGLSVTLGGRPMACGLEATSPPRYRCTYGMTGTELQAGAEAVQTVVVRLADAAGNVATASGSVLFDFRAPRLAAASLVHGPAADNPLAAVARARAGTRVSVSVLADEALDAAAPLELTAVSGAQTLHFERVAAAQTASSALFELIVPAGQQDGDYGLSLRWTDLAGNGGTVGSGLPTLRVKTSAPSLVVDQAALVFVRSPLGNAAAEPRGGFTIPAGPYVAVEPADPLSGAATLPAGALRLADGGALPLVLVQSGPAMGALSLGRLRPDAAGRFPRQALPGADVPGAWLAGVDDAGNVSPAVRLATSEWLATTNAPAFGESPHALLTTSSAQASRLQEVDPGAPEGAPAAGTDAGAVRVASAGAWRERTWSGAAPSARSGHAMAHDAARGRTVLFGGAQTNETWEYDGSNWVRAATSGPLARSLPAMAFDAARQRVVLFGGYGFVDGLGTALADTWEWDGARWRQVASAGPPARSGAAMAFDAARGRLLLFGGSSAEGGLLGDTWEWDGARWTLASAGGPSPRSQAAAAWDGPGRRVLLFGGFGAAGALGDTWAFGGGGWTQVASTGPAARGGHAMAYDAARARVVLAGGSTPYVNQADTWVWSGTAWALASASGLGGRTSFGLAHDAARGRTVAFGGGGFGVLGDTLEWTGTAWLAAAGPGPAARVDHAMVYDAAREQVVLFGGTGGGTLGDTWLWNGTAWARPVGAGPSARSQHAMAFGAVHARTVLFGGRDALGHRDDTWEWNGAFWVGLAPATRPASRRLHAMAYDFARGRTVLFGGVNDLGRLGDTWEWDGASWTLRATSGPSARNSALMAYDFARGRTVLYGGSSGATETWEWDGAAWALRATEGPSPRGQLVHDGERGRVMMMGATPMQEAWAWDGAAWQRTPSTGPAESRAGAAVVFDHARRRWVAFGGNVVGTGVAGDTWERSSGRPAVQVDVSFAAAGVAPSSIQAVSVRAWAGGALAPGRAEAAGAALLGWSSLGPDSEPGGWVPLAVNATGVAAAEPWLPAAPASLLAWSSASPAEAQRLVGGRTPTLSLQVRPASSLLAPDGDPAVALDFLEVRVRYAAP